MNIWSLEPTQSNNIMYKIAHCADVHIKNLKYHWEYKKIFSQMYETLRDEKVDYIYICVIHLGRMPLHPL